MKKLMPPILSVSLLTAGFTFPHPATAEGNLAADPPPAAAAVVTIDTAAPATPHSPRLFGGFIEHFDDQRHGCLVV